MTSPFQMRRIAPEAERIDARVIGEAAEWMTRLREGGDALSQAAFERWRQACPANDLAWQRLAALTGDIETGVASAGTPVSTQTLKQAALIRSRRNAIRWMLAGGGLAAGLWTVRDPGTLRTWTADARTSTGEQRTLTLADGTRLDINSGSALDIRHTATQRTLVLYRGEIRVTTGQDATRLFSVSTRAGTLTPVGTRFVVRDMDPSEKTIRVSVLDGMVDARPFGSDTQVRRIRAGEQADLTPGGASEVRPVPQGVASWVDGMVLANEMPLSDFLQELGRYRPGLLHCADSAAHLRVVGAFPVNDTEGALAMLQQVLPIRVRYLTRYLVYVDRV